MQPKTLNVQNPLSALFQYQEKQIYKLNIVEGSTVHIGIAEGIDDVVVCSIVADKPLAEVFATPPNMVSLLSKHLADNDTIEMLSPLKASQGTSIYVTGELFGNEQLAAHFTWRVACSGWADEDERKDLEIELAIADFFSVAAHIKPDPVFLMEEPEQAELITVQPLTDDAVGLESIQINPNMSVCDLLEQLGIPDCKSIQLKY